MCCITMEICLHLNFPCRYNSGCGLAAVGAWEEAEEVLRGAEQAARSYLQEEGETEEDIEEEVGIIRVSTKLLYRISYCT
jgi:hypothetical protein